jgi:Ca2+-binding EF-hand superfamily protein
MKHKFAFVCAAAFALVSTAALAEGDAKPKNSVEAKFESLDKDADGRLSKEELSGDKGLSWSFSTIDGNSDGYVTMDEFRAKVKMKPATSGQPY